MNFRNLLLPLLLVSPAAIASDALRVDHFVPAASAVTHHEFSCADPQGKQVDVRIAYVAARQAEGHAGRISALSFGDREAPSATLAEANRRLEGRVVEGISASCQKDGAIRLLAKLWTPGAGEQKVGWLAIVRNAKGEIEFP
jgi:hypothetical protein